MAGPGDLSPGSLATAPPAPRSGSELSKWLPWALGLVVGYAIFAGTPWGPGLTPDALSYLRSAQWLAEGWQVRQLPTQWPPGFPLLLAAARFLVFDPALSTRLCMAVIGAVNVLLLFRLSCRYGLDARYALLTTLLVLVQPVFLGVHLMLWSEPLFTALLLLDLLILPCLLDGTGRRYVPAWLGLVCGAAIVVRYAGLFLIAVNALALLGLSDQGQRFGERLRKTLWSSVVALLPLSGWLAFNHWRGLAATNRVLTWHPAGRVQLEELATSIGEWFQVGHGSGWLALLALSLALGIGLGQAFRRAERRRDAVLSLCVVAYVGFLWLTISTVDYYTPLDQRILSPVFPVATAALAVLASHVMPRWRWLAWLFAALLLVWLARGVHASATDWRQSRVQGLYLSNRDFRDLPVLEPLRRLPADVHILSNGPEVLELYVPRAAEMMPDRYSPMSRLPTPGYERTMAAAVARADLIVYLQPMAKRTYLASPAELDRLPGFARVYEDPYAIVWARAGAPPSAPRPIGGK